MSFFVEWMYLGKGKIHEFEVEVLRLRTGDWEEEEEEKGEFERLDVVLKSEELCNASVVDRAGAMLQPMFDKAQSYPSSLSFALSLITYQLLTNYFIMEYYPINSTIY